MKKLLYSLAIVMLTLFAVSQLNAVNKPQPKHLINAELTIGKDKFSHTFEVPVVSAVKKRPLVDYQFTGGFYAFTGGCPKDIGCEYGVILIADAITDEKSIVTAELIFKDRSECNSTKELIVVRGKPTATNMKCGARIKAYYNSQ